MPGYRLGVPQRGKYKLVFNTDDKKYGGDGKITKRIFSAVKKPGHGKPFSIPIDMPKLTCLYLVREPDAPKAAKTNGGRAVKAPGKASAAKAPKKV